MLVAGNIGGTKTDLAIFKSEVGPLSPLVQARVHSADFHRVHGPHPDPRCCQSSRTSGRPHADSRTPQEKLTTVKDLAWFYRLGMPLGKKDLRR